jgi:pimeloyl-ACP methyl ester carboxylesterase
MRSINLKIVVSLTVCWSVIFTIAAVTQAQNTTLKSQIVAVDGHQMHVLSSGLDNRKPGEPVVVFESGAVSPSSTWGAVLSRVAEFAPVVAYDRSTTGKSEWDGELGTADHVNRKLKRLLDTLNVEPPYVRVGFSFGGDLVRHFAGDYPDEVCGLVYVDPTIRSPKARLETLKLIGSGEEGYDAILRVDAAFAESLPPARRAAVEPVISVFKENVEPDFAPAPKVPTIMLLAGKLPDQSDNLHRGQVMPFDMNKFVNARLKNRIDRLSDWVLDAPEGMVVIARNSGHAIHQEEPDLVVDAIRRVVFPDVGRQLLQAINQEGKAALETTYEALSRRYPPEHFDEDLLNSLGYDLLRNNRIEEAIAVFEYNVEKYPNSWNSYDSLGDAFSAAENSEKAMESYRRSLELNPNSPSAQKLQELEHQ